MPATPPPREPFWSCSIESLFTTLQSQAEGLSTRDATGRHSRDRRLLVATSRSLRALRLFLSQFGSPITLILMVAAALALFLNDAADGTIILAIVFAGALLGFWQEYGAANALEALASLVHLTATVLRDGREVEAPTDRIVPGDVVLIAAGSSIPADCRLIEARDLFVNEAALTGESFPVEKQPGTTDAESPLARRSNVLLRGSHVVSGTGRALVVHVGDETEMGRIGQRLRLRPPENEFERGVRRLGALLLEVTLLLVLTIFVTHLGLRRPPLESFLFALALAVGLTPQLLPAVISVNLAFGARWLAERSVIVRRLTSIENFGSMNVLCSDKTGTLTEGVVVVERVVDCRGNKSPEALRSARLNA